MLKKETIQTFLFVVLYGLGFYTIQVFLHQRDMVTAMPGNYTLVQLDAGWYSFIAREGYMYKGGRGNVGFYPLFPLIWKITHLNAFGISVLNMIFLGCGFSILAALYKPDTTEKFLWITTPSLFYAFVPYTEALAILLGALLLLGIARDKRNYIWISLLLLGLLRPVAIVLLPALLLAELLSNEHRNWLVGIFNLNVENCSVKVMDVYGRNLKNVTVSNGILDLSGYAGGVYFLSIKKDDLYLKQRIVINK